MKTIVVYGAKGGVGTTTIACALAVAYADKGRTLLVDEQGDCAAALGCPADDDGYGRPVRDCLDMLSKPDAATLDSVAATERYDYAVVDAGRVPDWHRLDPTETILVVRPCYLALRAAVTLPRPPDRVFCVTEPGRVLTTRDVERVIPTAHVTDIPYDPAVARAVDAGLLATRMQQTLTRALRQIVWAANMADKNGGTE